MYDAKLLSYFVLWRKELNAHYKNLLKMVKMGHPPKCKAQLSCGKVMKTDQLKTWRKTAIHFLLNINGCCYFFFVVAVIAVVVFVVVVVSVVANKYFDSKVKHAHPLKNILLFVCECVDRKPFCSGVTAVAQIFLVASFLNLDCSRIVLSREKCASILSFCDTYHTTLVLYFNPFKHSTENNLYPIETASIQVNFSFILSLI